MVYTPNNVQSSGFPLDDFTFTYLLSGAPVAGQDEGKAVTLDLTAANTFKLCGAGDKIYGRLFSIENRTVVGFTTGAVQRKFKESMPAALGHGIAVGDSVVGAAGGTVAKLTSGTADNVVVETGDTYVVVEKL